MRTVESNDTSRYKSSDEADACPNQPTTPVAHASGSALCPITLHTGKGILDVPRLERRPGLGRLDKQRAHGKRDLSIIRSVFPSAFVARIKSRINLAFSQERRGHVVFSKVRLLKGLFDVQRRDRQRANHFEREEADNISSIVVGFKVEMRR
jgi:hypothetical protein